MVKTRHLQHDLSSTSEPPKLGTRSCVRQGGRPGAPVRVPRDVQVTRVAIAWSDAQRAD